MAKLILGASLDDRSNGPQKFATAADALKTILSDIRLYLCWLRPLVPKLLCKHPTAPRRRCPAEDGLDS